MLEFFRDKRKIIGYVFIGLFSIFVFWISYANCFSSMSWLMIPDPTYAYLFGGLNIATLNTVDLTGHPGITLQVLIGILTRIFYFFASDADVHSIFQSVFVNLEWYMRNINISIFILHASIVLVVSVKIWSSFNNIPLLCVALSGLFVYYNFIPWSTQRLWPESLLVPLILLQLLIVLERLRDNSTIPSNCLVWGAGALAAAALFTKILFFPIFGISFFFWKDWKYRGRYLFGFFCVVILCSLCMWDSLPRTALWFFGIISRTGIYNSGAYTFLSFDVLLNSMERIAKTEKITLVLLALEFIALVVFWKKKHALEWRISALSLFSLVFIIFFIGKHYSPRYFLIIYMPVFFLTFIPLAFCNRIEISVLACLLCIFLGGASVDKIYDGIDARNKRKISEEEFYSYDDPVFDEALIIEDHDVRTKSAKMGFGSYVSATAGRFGSFFSSDSGTPFDELLRKMYPHNFYINIYSGMIFHFGKLVTFKELSSFGRPIIIVTSALSFIQKRCVLGKKITVFTNKYNNASTIAFELLEMKK